MTRAVRGTVRWAAAMVVVAACSACGSDDKASTDTSTTTTAASAAGSSTTAAASSGAVDVKTTAAPMGTIVVDGAGNTLYAFTPDTATNSACTDACASTWPPAIASAAPKGGDGVDSAALGLLTRADGTKQVTYHDHPLYRYAGDSGPGDSVGQGVGGKWFVVGSDGNLVKDTPGAGGPSSTAGSAAPTSAAPTTADSGY